MADGVVDAQKGSRAARSAGVLDDDIGADRDEGAEREGGGVTLAIDLFCGLGGWTDGLIAEGYDVIGFDIERHDYGDGAKYPAQLVLQDVLTLHGRQFKDAALIVASPPCQEYSYMAMPWSLAKAKAAEYRSGVRDISKLTALYDACFRIQREASEAAGCRVPMVVENVRGAQPWIGKAAFNYGSFYLWGDVPALMPVAKKLHKVGSLGWSEFAKTGKKSKGFNTTADQIVHGRASADRSYFAGAGSKCGGGWFGAGNDRSLTRQHSSKSKARKAASAAIAKIPFPLAQHIARAYKP